MMKHSQKLPQARNRSLLSRSRGAVKPKSVSKTTCPAPYKTLLLCDYPTLSVRQPVWSELKVIPFLSSLITGPVHALSPQHVRTKPTQQRTSNQPSFQGNTRSGFIPSSSSLLRSSARLGDERSHAANLCHANPCLEPKIDLLHTHFGALLIAALRDPQRLNNRRICFVWKHLNGLGLSLGILESNSISIGPDSILRANNNAPLLLCHGLSDDAWNPDDRMSHAFGNRQLNDDCDCADELRSSFHDRGISN